MITLSAITWQGHVRFWRDNDLVFNNNHPLTLYISVKVKGNNGRQFKGTQLAAHRSHGDIEEFLGEFTEYPTDKMKTLNCIGGKRVW